MKLPLTLLVLLLVGCSGVTAPSTHTVNGTLFLANNGYVVRNGQNMEFAKPGGSLFPCAGTGGFSDIATGAQVSAINESGTVLALGTLADDIIATASALGPTPLYKTTCNFTFSIPNVPDAAFYSFKLGSRNGPNYSKADMEANGWHVALTLG